MEKQQYMIAAVPTGDNKTQIDDIRSSFSKKYKVDEALRNPAHITIVPPFHATTEQITVLDQGLKEILERFNKFSLHITGYSFFRKNRVVFLKPKKNTVIEDLYIQVQQFFSQKMPEIKLIKQVNYSPHITIGYRDLDRFTFKDAVSDLEHKTESINWNIDHIEIWKRESGNWQNIKKLSIT